MGSRKATINHVVAQGEKVGDLNRNVALVRMENLTLGLVEEIKVRLSKTFFVFFFVEPQRGPSTEKFLCEKN